MIKRTHGAIAKKNVLFSKRCWHHFSSEEIRSKSVTMHYCKRSVNLYCSSIVLVRRPQSCWPNGGIWRKIGAKYLSHMKKDLCQNSMKTNLSLFFQHQLTTYFYVPLKINSGPCGLGSNGNFYAIEIFGSFALSGVEPMQ